jgi:hypothetical protein
MSGQTEDERPQLESGEVVEIGGEDFVTITESGSSGAWIRVSEDSFIQDPDATSEEDTS